jgi:hypothetical protein
MADPSFYYAIFKKLQAACGGDLATGGGHLSPDDDPELAGGFSLREPQNQYGIYKHLSTTHASDYTADGVTPLDSSMQPLNPMSNDPMQNPLFVMLQASLTPGGLPPGQGYHFVTVGNKNWPVMPPPNLQGLPTDHHEWVDFNTGSHKLIDAFATWITNGKADDSPKDAPLTYAALTQTPPPKIPGTPDSGKGLFPILFVASMAGDDGRRTGDGSLPDVGPNHVPAHFWATSQIFLTDTMGNTVDPPTLDSQAEYCVAAVIGNNGNWDAGRVSGSKIFVTCEAMAFNSGLSPGTLLPALSNLDTTIPNGLYEQYSLRRQGYDVVGFRFAVDTVFANIKKAMVDAGITPAQLGATSIDAWVRASHACVKVLIVAGEDIMLFPPAGNIPFTDKSDPQKDRHIAQHNLAPFNIAVGGKKQLVWQNFMVGQAGTGMNGLVLQHALPPEAFQLYLAIPTAIYERYIAKGGAVRGFEPLRADGRETASRPFPEAVILHQTARDAEIRVADHAREPFFGMALGIEVDPAALKGQRLGDIAMVHSAAEGGVVGGFTLRPQMRR